jgi:hypothetical protein
VGHGGLGSHGIELLEDDQLRSGLCKDTIPELTTELYDRCENVCSFLGNFA